MEVGGAIGASGTPIVIDSAGKIESIMPDEIHADIETGTDSFVQHIESVGASSDGDFTGSLTTKNLTYDGNQNDPRGIDVAGDLDADLAFGNGIFDPITVHGDLNGDIDVAVTHKNRIVIGGSLNGDITIGTAGLEGFISINADNDATGDWDGDVIVGSYTLGTGQTGVDEAPEYKRTVAQLGGGAIGIVNSWGFHPTDTYPADGFVIGQPAFMSDSTVRIFHYGPIDDEVQGTITIQSQPISGGSWANGGDFDFTFDSGSPRELKITPADGNAWEEGKKYKITVSTGALQIPTSVLTAGSNVDVDGYTYEFSFEAN